MKRILIALGAVTMIVAFPVVWVFGYLVGHRDLIFGDGRVTTVSRLSPDDTILARLIEISFTPSVGRHFKLQLQSDRWGTKDIFVSPEEEYAGQPGSERLVWSKDGTKLLLVGRHFFVKDDLFLDNGDQAFFLYDLPTNTGWCNSEEAVPFPPLKAEQIEAIEFTEPARLKTRMSLDLQPRRGDRIQGDPANDQRRSDPTYR